MFLVMEEIVVDAVVYREDEGANSRDRRSALEKNGQLLKRY